MLVSEDIGSRLTITIVSLATNQHTNKSALSSAFTTKHSNFDVDLNSLNFIPSDFYLRNFSFIAFLNLSHHQLGIQVSSHEKQCP